MVVGAQGVGDLALSPDGMHAAYVVTVPRAPGEPGGVASQEIWVVRCDGSTPARRYTPAKQRAWAPAFATDGRRLAFLSTRPTPGAGEAGDDTADLFVLDLDGGEARLLSDGKISPSAFRWSPRGDRIAFVGREPETDNEKAAKKEGRDWEVVDQDPKPARLWIVDVGTGVRTQVTSGSAHVLGFDWSPDGERFVLRVTDTPRVDDDYMHSRLGLVPAAGGEISPLVQTAGKLGNPVFSPDGAWVAWLGATDTSDPAAGMVCVAPASGGDIEVVRPARADIATDIVWANPATLAVSVTRGTESRLELVARNGGAARTVLSETPVFSSVGLSRDGRIVALVGSTPECPNEVYAGAVARGSAGLKRLTTTNPEFESAQIGTQEVVRWKAKDGFEIEGLLVRPVGFVTGERYPLVVIVHGGPESCYRNGWNTSYGAPTQLLAGRGYCVLQPNYRGSTGRGEAFESADHRDLMGAEFEDILAGIDFLAGQGLVDPARVGIMGGSYGGYTTTWAATAHSPRFAVAIASAAITDWFSMQGTSDIPEENALVHWALPFYANFDLYWQRSPVAHVNDCRTPLLLLHGEKDLRVPIGQGQELYTALRLLGRPVEFVRYPREGHGLRETAHQRDALVRSLEWLDRYLGREAAGKGAAR
jgi:dipeptidyl aminopeptidase/acylaminoacyl peptidase